MMRLECVNTVSIKLFADDVKLYHVLEVPFEVSSNALQSELENLGAWSATWQLKISESKCSVLHLGSRNPGLTYSINNCQLPSVDGCRDLGIHVTQALKFKAHCTQIAAKAYKVINMLFRCFLTSNQEAIITAYKAFVIPILEYGAPVWSSQFLLDIDLIESTQRYFTRRLFGRMGKDTTTPYPERLRQLNLEPLELRRLHADLCLCYKIVHHDIDISLSDFFSQPPPATVTTRGHSLKLYSKRAKTDIFKHSFAYRVVAIWNALPEFVNGEPLIRAANCSKFKKRLKLVDLMQYLKFNRNM